MYKFLQDQCEPIKSSAHNMERQSDCCPNSLLVPWASQARFKLPSNLESFSSQLIKYCAELIPTSALTSQYHLIFSVLCIEKEKKAAWLMKKEQSTMIVDDVRMDLTRVQGKEVEEGLHSLQRATHSANMDNKSNIDKLVGGVDLMLEKMKRLSLGFQKDKCTTFQATFFAQFQNEQWLYQLHLKKQKISWKGLFWPQTTMETTTVSLVEMVKASKAMFSRETCPL